ncbi:MAG: DNA-directed RNA polymerase subunit alpha [Minisyncoccales bacterium]|jgi:DNA-directed RNA polymerase subunit alpha
MISLPSKPKIIQEEENRATFEIEGLYPGYGVTIGNSLRRVLLSSLEGSAVTSVKIKGVQHEFSTKDGILEDIISIILNIKKLRFKTFSNEPQTVILSVKGEKDVKGSDLEVPTQLELVNKDLHIATLTEKKSELEMELTVERGFGFVIADQDKRDKLEVGQISIDSIFTPIKSVNFKVENMRVGKRTDFDRLFLEIETDGTIKPEEALKEASDILANHFLVIANRETEELSDNKIEEVKETEDVKDLTKIAIDDIEISSRTANVLIKAGVKTVAGIARRSKESLLKIEGMGDKGVDEIEKALQEFEIELK